MIKHKEGQWLLYSHQGKLLGRHDTREQAEKQEEAINISKHEKSRTWASRHGFK